MKIDTTIQYTERDKLVIKLATIKAWLQISKWLLIALYFFLGAVVVSASAEDVLKTGTLNVIGDSLAFLLFLILLVICAHLLFSRIYAGIVVGALIYLAIVVAYIASELQPNGEHTNTITAFCVFLPILAVFINTLRVAYKYKRIVEQLQNSHTT